MLFAWAMLALWVLGLFSLHREALRGAGLAPAAPAGGRRPRRAVPRPARPARSCSRRSGSTATTLALGGLIFLAMPRRPTMARTRRAATPSRKHLTGFDDEVQLGQLGEILENDSVVMSVELFDEHGPADRARRASRSGGA